MQTVIASSSENFAAGLLGDRVAISVWRGEPTFTDFERQRATISMAVTKNPRSCAFVCAIESTSPKPATDFQARVTKMFEQFGADLGAVAYIVEGGALRSAFVRSIMTGITIAKGTSQPMKYFPTVESAESWVRATINLPSEIALRSAVEDVRRAIVPAA